MNQFNDQILAFEKKLSLFESLLRDHQQNSDVHHHMMIQASEFRSQLRMFNEQREHRQVGSAYKVLDSFLCTLLAFIGGDVDRAILALNRCIQKSNANAMMILASIYASGIYAEKDIEKSNLLYHQAAELGNPQAERNIAKSYYFGLGMEKNIEQAYSYFLRAANKNDPEAMFYLGEMFEKGLAVSVDIGRANEYYNLSAKAGYRDAIIKKIPTDSEILPPPFRLNHESTNTSKSIIVPSPIALNGIELQLDKKDPKQGRGASISKIRDLGHDHAQDPGNEATSIAREEKANKNNKSLAKPIGLLAAENSISKNKRPGSNAKKNIRNRKRKPSLHPSDLQFLAILISMIAIFFTVYFASPAILWQDWNGVVKKIVKLSDFSQRKSGKKSSHNRRVAFKGIQTWCGAFIKKERNKKLQKRSKLPVICHFGGARSLDDLAESFSYLRLRWQGGSPPINYNPKKTGSFKLVRLWCLMPNKPFLGQTPVEEKFVCGFKSLSKAKDIRSHFYNYRVSVLKLNKL